MLVHSPTLSFGSSPRLLSRPFRRRGSLAFFFPAVLFTVIDALGFCFSRLDMITSSLSRLSTLKGGVGSPIPCNSLLLRTHVAHAPH